MQFEKEWQNSLQSNDIGSLISGTLTLFLSCNLKSIKLSTPTPSAPLQPYFPGPKPVTDTMKS